MLGSLILIFKQTMRLSAHTHTQTGRYLEELHEEHQPQMHQACQGDPGRLLPKGHQEPRNWMLPFLCIVM